MTRRLLLLCAACIIAVCALFFSISRAQAPEPPFTASLKTRTAFWKERIAAAGPARAYQEFSDSVASLSINDQHENAHTFGGALYESEGVDGLTTCDARFSYGCFHEFLGRAISDLGLGVVDALNQACVDALKTSTLSCQHGIGHGIQAALGYDDAALRKALDTCRSLPYIDPIGGCYGGVFMEYNMQTMLGEQAVTRPVSHGDPLYPCDDLAEPYRLACAFWSPQWWIDLQHRTDATAPDFKAIGELCDSFEEHALVRACYEGLGTVTPPEAAFNASNTKKMCTAASSDPRRQLYCLSYAANSLAIDGAAFGVDAESVCDGLPEDSREYCIAYAQNKANIAVPLEDLADERSGR